MKIKYSLIVLLPSIVFFTYLVTVDQQAACMFLILLLVFGLLIYFSRKTNNNVLTSIVSLAAIAHVLGAPLFIVNKEDYSYSGWNAVKDFDFSNFMFLNVYAYSISSLLLVILFTGILESIVTNGIGKSLAFQSNFEKAAYFDKEPTHRNTISWNIILIFLLILSLVLAIIMYINNIAVLGIESERLPFRLVGILFYLRGYGLPIILFIVYRKTSQSGFLSVLFILVALIVGALSASRGVTFMYLFPILVGILVVKISVQRIILVVGLVILGYFTTSLTRDIVYSTSNLSLWDLPSLLISSKSSFSSDDGMFLSLLSILGTMSNRLYGAQDSVLAYQHVLVDPWLSFFDFIVTGSLVSNLAEDLYGLVFLPGAGYGVGLGLMALLVMIGRADIFLLIFAALFFAILIVIINRLLQRLFFNKQSGKYFQLYYLILFISSFNFLQSSIPYIYTILFSTWLLGFFFNRKFKKRH